MFAHKKSSNFSKPCQWNDIFIDKITKDASIKEKISIRQVKLLKRGYKHNKISIKRQIHRINQKGKLIPCIDFPSEKQLTPTTSFPNSHDNRNKNEHNNNCCQPFYQEPLHTPKNAYFKVYKANKTYPTSFKTINFILKNPQSEYNHHLFQKPTFEKIAQTVDTKKKQSSCEQQEQRNSSFYFIDPVNSNQNQAQSPIFISKGQKIQMYNEQSELNEQLSELRQTRHRSNTKSSKIKKSLVLKKMNSFYQGQQKKESRKSSKLLRINTLNAKIAESQCCGSDNQQDEFSEIQEKLANIISKPQSGNQSDNQQQQEQQNYGNFTFHNKRWLTNF